MLCYIIVDFPWLRLLYLYIYNKSCLEPYRKFLEKADRDGFDGKYSLLNLFEP